MATAAGVIVRSEELVGLVVATAGLVSRGRGLRCLVVLRRLMVVCSDRCANMLTDILPADRFQDRKETFWYLRPAVRILTLIMMRTM